MAKKKLSKKHHKENNRLLFLLFLVLSFVLIMAYMSMDFNKHKPYGKQDVIASINSSTVTIPDTSEVVSLVDGKANFSGDVEGTVSLSDPYYSLKSGTTYDTFVVMTYNTGGSGEFVARSYVYYSK